MDKTLNWKNIWYNYFIYNISIIKINNIISNYDIKFDDYISYILYAIIALINDNKYINIYLLENAIKNYKNYKNYKINNILLRLPSDMLNIIGNQYFEPKYRLKDGLNLDKFELKHLAKNYNALGSLDSILLNDNSIDFWIYGILLNKNPKALELIDKNLELIFNLLKGNTIFYTFLTINHNNKAIEIFERYWPSNNYIYLGYLLENGCDKAVDFILNHIDEIMIELNNKLNNEYWGHIAKNPNNKLLKLLQDYINTNHQNFIKTSCTIWYNLALNSNPLAIELLLKNIENIDINESILLHNLASNKNDNALNFVLSHKKINKPNDESFMILDNLAANPNDLAVDYIINILDNYKNLEYEKYIYDNLAANPNDKAVDYIINILDNYKNSEYEKLVFPNEIPNKMMYCLAENPNDKAVDYIINNVLNKETESSFYQLLSENPKIFQIDKTDMENKISILKNVINIINNYLRVL
jgi:hypothetical protein